MFENKTSILPEVEEAPAVVNKGSLEELARKAALTREARNEEYALKFDEYMQKARMLDEQGIRGDVRDHETKLYRDNIASEMYSSAFDQTVADTQNYLERMQRASELVGEIEDLYVDALQTYGSEEFLKFANKNQDIYQRDTDYQKRLQKLMSVRAKAAQMEEEEGLFAEFLDATKAFMMIPNALDNFVFSGGSPRQLVDDIRSWAYEIEKLPPELQEQAYGALGPFIQEHKSWLTNPQDVVEQIDLVVSGDDRDINSYTAWAAVDLAVIGTIAGWIAKSGKKIKDVADSKEAISKLGADGAESTVESSQVLNNDVVEDTSAILKQQARYDIPDYTPDVVPGGVARAGETISESLLKDAQKVMSRKDRADAEAELSKLKSSLEGATGKDARQLRNRLKKAEQRIALDDKYRAARSEVSRIEGRNQRQAGESVEEIPNELRHKANQRVSNSVRVGWHEELNKLEGKTDKASKAKIKRLQKKFEADNEAILAQREINAIVARNKGKGSVAKTPLAKAIEPEEKPKFIIGMANGRGATGPIKFESVTVREAAGNQAIADDIVSGTRKLSKDPAEEVLESAPLHRPNASRWGSLGEYIQKAASRNEVTLSKLVGGFASPARIAELMKRSLDDFEQTYKGNGVISTHMDEATGKVQIDLGSDKGAAFTSKEQANKAIEDLGLNDIDVLDGKPVVIPSSDGFLIRLSHGSSDALEAWRGLGLIKKNVGNIQDVVPGLSNLAQQADDAFRGASAVVERMFNQHLRKFRGKKGKNLLSVIKDQQKIRHSYKDADGNVRHARGRWFSEDEFTAHYRNKFGKAPSPDELLGFITYRQLNDYGYDLKVKIMSQSIVARGDKVYLLEGREGIKVPVLGHKIDTKSLIGRESNEEAIMIGTEDGKYFARGKMSKKDLEELDKFDIIEIHPSHREDMFQTHRAEAPVRYMAVPKGSKTRDFLPTDIANYVGGGRIVNESPFFIKVGATVTDSGGQTFRLNDMTLFAASSSSQAKEGAKKINELVTLMKENVDDLGRLTDETIKRIGLDQVGIDSVEAAHKFMQSKNLYRSNIVIEGIGDRKMVNMGDISSFKKVDKAAVSNTFRSQIFGERSMEGVDNILGTKATEADPLTAMITSLNMVNEFASTAALRERSLAYFRREFGNDITGDSAHPYDMLSAKVKESVKIANPEKARAIEAHQQYLRDTLRMNATEEMAWTNFVDKTFTKIFKMKDSMFGLDETPEVLQKTLEGRQALIDSFGLSPSAKVRTFTFHSTLGMFNPGTFIMQYINAANIMAVAGMPGVKAAGQALALRGALLSRDGKFLDMTAKNYKLLGFNSEQEVKEIIEDMWLTGLDVVGSTHVTAQGLGKAQIQGGFSQFAKNASTVFMDQGEILNRMTARLTAINEYRKLNPGKAINTEEARGAISKRLHALTLGMSRSDTQLLLRKPMTSIPMQFWSYPMRLTMAMLPKAMGGSTMFTKAEKWRLAAANVILWGGAGYPLLGYLTDSIAEKYEMDHRAAKLMTNGLFDWSLYMFSGGEWDTNMSDRVGSHMFYQPIIEGFMGDKSAFEMLLGATGGRGSQLADLPSALSMFMAARDPDAVTDAGLRALTSLSSGMNSWFRTYLALQYGKIYSRNGRPLAGVSDMEGWLMGFGIPPQAYADIGMEFDNEKRKKELIDHFAELYRRAYRNLDQAETEEERDAIRETLVAIDIPAYDAGVQKEAEWRVLNEDDYSDTMQKEADKYFRERTFGTYKQTAGAKLRAEKQDRRRRQQEQEEDK